jgi:hypothetical protein
MFLLVAMAAAFCGCSEIFTATAGIAKIFSLFSCYRWFSNSGTFHQPLIDRRFLSTPQGSEIDLSEKQP